VGGEYDAVVDDALLLDKGVVARLFRVDQSAVDRSESSPQVPARKGHKTYTMVRNFWLTIYSWLHACG
jgi:hypothetical protein